MMPSPAYRYTKDHVGDQHYEDFFRDRDADGWDVAMERLVARRDIIKPQKIPVFLSDKRRNDFIFLLPLDQDSVVLDFGSGWGNTSYTLSHHCRQVVAMEADAGRLRFSAAHFRHSGANNILPIQSGNARKLPFADNSFDIVIMNGVLEWTPRSIDGRPDKVHRSVLAELNRVLKPGGTIAVSIENRFSYKWITGIRDHHAGGLRWASCLPRWLTNIYSLIRLQQPYRAWLYSSSKLKKLFQENGFPDVKLHSYHPNHVTFRYLFRIDDNENALRFLKNILSQFSLPWRDRLAYRLAVAGIPYRSIAHDYLAIAKSTEESRPIPESFLSKIVQHCPVSSKADIDLYSATRSVLLEISENGCGKGIGKFSRDRRWNANIEKESLALQHYETFGIRSNVNVPKVLFAGSVNKYALAVMSYARGAAQFNAETQMLLRPKIREWLVALALKRKSPDVAQNPLPWWNDATSALRIEASSLKLDARLESFRGVLVHGDLSPNNILTDETGISVIDWEFSEIDGLPLMDLIDYLLYCQFQESRNYEESWEIIFDGEGYKEITAYCDALDIDEDLILILAEQFVLKKIALLASLPEPGAQRKCTQLKNVYLSNFANT